VSCGFFAGRGRVAARGTRPPMQLHSSPVQDQANTCHVRSCASAAPQSLWHSTGMAFTAAPEPLFVPYCKFVRVGSCRSVSVFISYTSSNNCLLRPHHVCEWPNLRSALTTTWCDTLIYTYNVNFLVHMATATVPQPYGYWLLTMPCTMSRVPQASLLATWRAAAAAAKETQGFGSGNYWSMLGARICVRDATLEPCCSPMHGQLPCRTDACSACSARTTHVMQKTM